MTGAILLAAGRSTGMGTQKLLLPWGERAQHSTGEARGCNPLSGGAREERTIIEHIAGVVLDSGVGPIVGVVSEANAEVQRRLEGLGIQTVCNPNPDEGMLSSVRCGMESLPADLPGFMVVPGDIPSITTELVQTLSNAFDADPSRIVVPIAGGRRGHPIIVPMRFREAVLTRYDGAGLKGLMSEYPEAVHEVPANPGSIGPDIDTPEEYKRATGGPDYGR